MKRLWLVVVGAIHCIALPCIAAQPEVDRKPAKVEVVGNVHIAREATKADPKDAPCVPATDQRTSDLCAQWKAADAADASARYAMFALWISLFTLIGVAVTVLHTQQTVRIAQATLQADRAWLTPRIPKITWKGHRDPDGKPYQPVLSIRLQWENTGRSPAVNIRHFAQFRLIPKDTHPPAFTPDKVHHVAALGVGRPFNPLLQKIAGEFAVQYLTREADLYVYSRIDYDDVFGKAHTSEICYQVLPRELKSPGVTMAIKTIGKAFGDQNKLS